MLHQEQIVRYEDSIYKIKIKNSKKKVNQNGIFLDLIKGKEHGGKKKLKFMETVNASDQA